MKIQPGESVVIILHSPREKVVGLLHEINAAGVFVRAIDLNYFDEWTRAIANGEDYLAMQDYFYPMWRVERMTRDESANGIPSMAELLRQRTGREFGEL